jgi:hypothetical protein
MEGTEMVATEQQGLDRRGFLSGATAATAVIISGGAVIHTTEAWGYAPTALKPETFATLVRLARDIYPHDRLADKFYAIAMKAHDEKAKKDDKVRADIEKNVAELNAIAKKAHGADYANVGWEKERVAILRGIQKGKFFQGIRGGLVVSLYNQPDVWPTFGYQGESASKGGYIARGFNDINWL